MDLILLVINRLTIIFQAISEILQPFLLRLDGLVSSSVDLLLIPLQIVIGLDLVV